MNEELDRANAIVAARTPGKWEVRTHIDQGVMGAGPVHHWETEDSEDIDPDIPAQKDAEFIAFASAVMPELLAVARAAGTLRSNDVLVTEHFWRDRLLKTIESPAEAALDAALLDLGFALREALK